MSPENPLVQAERLERTLGAGGYRSADLDRLAVLYRESAGPCSGDRIHSFVVVIPVAERPAMLRRCLEGLLEEVLLFNYPGRGAGGPSVSAVIVDDGRPGAGSHDARRLADEVSARGLPAVYWGLAEQERIVGRIPPLLRRELSAVGRAGRGPVGPRKGAAVTRNIAGMALRALVEDPKCLFWYVDSDETWRVRVERPAGPADVRAFSYFHGLDRAFRSGTVDMVTGHVVGDPPVSPAVMIGRFLEDVVGFLRTIGPLDPDGPCPFHARGPEAAKRAAGGHTASYHDFAEIFGYPVPGVPAGYHCPITADHTAGEAEDDFLGTLNGFFSGHHPTRSTALDPALPPGFSEPARTVYTGNYVVGERARSAWIPFAGLGFRMAGPAFGRIMRARYGPRFAKVNLPLLHMRTIAGSDRGEYRPGAIVDGEAPPDLSGEFRRQFWGDVLLFGIDQLCAEGFPDQEIPYATIISVLEQWHETIRSHYKERTARVDRTLAFLEQAVGEYMGDRYRRPQETGTALRRFTDGVRRNFASTAPIVRELMDRDRTSARLAEIAAALSDLPRQEALWQEASECVRGRRPEISSPFP